MCNPFSIGVLALARMFREEISKLEDGIEWRVIHSRRLKYIYVYNNHGTGTIVSIDDIRYFHGLSGYKPINRSKAKTFVLETLSEIKEKIPKNAKSFNLPQFKITENVDFNEYATFFKFAPRMELKRLALFLHATDNWFRCDSCQSLLHYTRLRSLVDFEYKCLSCEAHAVMKPNSLEEVI